MWKALIPILSMEVLTCTSGMDCSFPESCRCGMCYCVRSTKSIIASGSSPFVEPNTEYVCQVLKRWSACGMLCLWSFELLHAVPWLRTSMYRNRQEYPPLRDPIDPGDGSLDWYYGDHAGGMAFDFGKHNGRKIHAVCLNYIAWWYTTRTASGRSVRFSLVEHIAHWSLDTASHPKCHWTIRGRAQRICKEELPRFRCAVWTETWRTNHWRMQG